MDRSIVLELSEAIPILARFSDNDIVTKTWIKVIDKFVNNLENTPYIEKYVTQAKKMRDKIVETIKIINYRSDYAKYHSITEFLDRAKTDIETWLGLNAIRTGGLSESTPLRKELKQETKDLIMLELEGKSQRPTDALDVYDVRGEPLSSIWNHTIKKLEEDHNRLRQKNKQKLTLELSKDDEITEDTKLLDLVRSGRIDIAKGLQRECDKHEH